MILHAGISKAFGQLKGGENVSSLGRTDPIDLNKLFETCRGKVGQ